MVTSLLALRNFAKKFFGEVDLVETGVDAATTGVLLCMLFVGTGDFSREDLVSLAPSGLHEAPLFFLNSTLILLIVAM